MAGKAPTYRCVVNPRGEDLGHASFILRAGLAGDYHVPAYTTPLSLKSVARGLATYATPRTRYRVDPQSLVVLNEGQTYAMDIDVRDRTGTLALFFERGMVEGVARAMQGGERAVLEPEESAAPRLEIHERLHAKTGAMAAHLGALEQGIASGEASAASIEDRMLAIAAEIAILDARARREATAFPGLRASTRDEAYRRLHWARDWLDASFAEPLTIGGLARVACMSPYHFQRLFKRAFGETPMQRVQRLRLAAAARLLGESEAPVTRVCLDVGFESLGSFSALFRRRFGASPREFRQMRRIREAGDRGAP